MGKQVYNNYRKTFKTYLVIIIMIISQMSGARVELK
jgi:hypothetical protein